MLTGSFMAGCGFQEYPKWVGDVVVQNEAEERAHLAATGALTTAAEAAQTPPSPAAIRMRRSRERKRDGKRTIRFDIQAAHVDALILAGWLDQSTRDDMAEAACGLNRLLDKLAAPRSVGGSQSPASRRRSARAIGASSIVTRDRAGCAINAPPPLFWDFLARCPVPAAQEEVL
jgi:hypothetical protein